MSFQHRHTTSLGKGYKQTQSNRTTRGKGYKQAQSDRGKKKRSIADVACLNIEVEVCLESVGLP
jgi:hypothetical protein